MVTKEPFDSSAPKPHPPLDEQRRVEGFHALLASDKSGPHLLEDTDGRLRPWRALSPEARLDYIAAAAAQYDVPFESFADAARDELGALPAMSSPFLRLAHQYKRELHALGRLLPDVGGAESASLIDRLRETLDWHERKIAGLAAHNHLLRDFSQEFVGQIAWPLSETRTQKPETRAPGPGPGGRLAADAASILFGDGVIPTASKDSPPPAARFHADGGRER
jgi:hypothetical protein